MKLEYAIALTGGIASGKTTASKILELLGYHVVCADSIAHKVLEENADEIIQTFGQEIIYNPLESKQDSGTMRINRKALGRIVFGDTNKRKILESITHPKIHSQILSIAKELDSHKQWYFLDIPLFFESGGKARYPVKYVLSIITSQELQLARLRQRDDLDLAQAQSRIQAQIPNEQKAKQSDFVIYNDSTLNALQSSIDSFLRALESKAL